MNARLRPLYAADIFDYQQVITDNSNIDINNVNNKNATAQLQLVQATQDDGSIDSSNVDSSNIDRNNNQQQQPKQLEQKQLKKKKQGQAASGVLVGSIRANFWGLRDSYRLQAGGHTGTLRQAMLGPMDVFRKRYDVEWNDRGFRVIRNRLVNSDEYAFFAAQQREPLATITRDANLIERDRWLIDLTDDNQLPPDALLIAVTAAIADEDN